jgi:hypothetical protein
MNNTNTKIKPEVKKENIIDNYYLFGHVEDSKTLEDYDIRMIITRPIKIHHLAPIELGNGSLVRGDIVSVEQDLVIEVMSEELLEGTTVFKLKYQLMCDDGILYGEEAGVYKYASFVPMLTSDNFMSKIFDMVEGKGGDEESSETKWKHFVNSYNRIYPFLKQKEEDDVTVLHAIYDLVIENMPTID